MKNLILKNGWILKEINENLEPFFCNIVIENGLIFEYNEKFHNDGYEVLDLGGRFITSPLTNFHEHIYSKLAKGFAINSDMENFAKILSDYWWKEDLCLSEESVYYSSLLTGIDSIKNGVGYLFDHHSSPNFIKGSLNIISEVLNSLGLNNVLCYEISDRNGKVKTEEALIENFEFISKNYPTSKGMIGLHASFTIDDFTLERVSELNKDLNSGIHVHICEGEDDRLLSVKKYGKTPLQRFLDYNLLNEKSILAHGVKLNSAEISILNEMNVSMALNIDSNLNNSVGIHNFNSLQRTKLLLGTDGMHSNMLKSLKNFFLILRSFGLSFENSFRFIKNIYNNSNKFLNKYFSTTKLSYGESADLVVWDYIPSTPVTSENIWGHVIYGMTESRAKHFLKNGEFLMKNFELPNIDEDKINYEAKKASLDLYNKFSEIG